MQTLRDNLCVNSSFISLSELKTKILEHVEWMHGRNEPNVARYYDRLDEIISYMENNVKL